MKNNKCIHKIKNECDKDVTFILLCAKKSNNRGYKNIPLTPINSRQKLIDVQIKIIRSVYKKSEIIIISGFENDKLVDHIHMAEYDNVRIAENKNYKNSNTLEGWKFALNLAVKKNIYIIHGDRIFSKNCFVKSNSSYTIFHNVEKNNYNLGVLHNKNKVINMSYGLESVWSEIFFLHIDDFECARRLINDKNKKIHNIESYINELLKRTDILIVEKKPEDITILKEI